MLVTFTERAYASHERNSDQTIKNSLLTTGVRRISMKRQCDLQVSIELVNFPIIYFITLRDTPEELYKRLEINVSLR